MITFWNVNGSSKLYDLSSQETEHLLQWSIVCLCETWLLYEPQKLSSLLQYYNMVFSPAVKEKQRGRPSGGLLILIKKHIQFEILDCSYLWIFLKVKISSIEFILGNVYINPTYDMTEATSLLEDLLAPLLFQEGYKTIIGGDFNDRI